MNWKQLLNTNRPRLSGLPERAGDQFERDYDSAIFSTPVKRLQDKAQVFPLEPHDAVRTRLTHSLEVSAVARELAVSVGRWLREEGLVEPGMERQIEAIAATCGLIHDLGNPPFGHAGEDAIREWFLKRGEERLRSELNGEEQQVQDFLRFEGNAQTLRLLSKLQLLADFNGLNLTYGTLSAACKYVGASDVARLDNPNHAHMKPGHFASENELVRTIREQTGTGASRNPITYLVEAADDTTYSVADIEDGIKKGIITWAKLESLLLESDEKDPKHFAKKILDLKTSILKAGRDTVPELSDDAHGAAFRAAAISLMIPDVVATFQKNYDAIMAGTYLGELVLDGDGAHFIRTVKHIGRSRIYCTTPNLKLVLMGRAIIQDLMDIFWEGAAQLPLDGSTETETFAGRVGKLLSPNYREVFCHFARQEPGNEVYHRYLLLTDHVCGMTDTFAKRIHMELLNG